MVKQFRVNILRFPAALGHYVLTCITLLIKKLFDRTALLIEIPTKDRKEKGTIVALKVDVLQRSQVTHEALKQSGKADKIT